MVLREERSWSRSWQFGKARGESVAFEPKEIRMYENSASHAQLFIEPSSQQTNPFGDTLYGAGTDLMKSELGAYGERLLGSGSAYVNSNVRECFKLVKISGVVVTTHLLILFGFGFISFAILFLPDPPHSKRSQQISRYFSNPQYYFEVNEQYVKNKLKVILFPFLHRGHWIRTTETIGGKPSYKTPIYDINAPDLYIPLMAFGTYVVLAGFFLGINGKFSPEALGVQCTNGLLCWIFQVLLLEATLHTLGDGDVPLLDVVAYGGYTFAAVSVSVLARIVWTYCFYVVTLWECFCMGMFFVKILKRILIAEVRSCEKHSSKRHYLLLLVAIAQIPLLFWLGNVSL